MKFNLIFSRLTISSKIFKGLYWIFFIGITISISTWDYEKGNNYIALFFIFALLVTFLSQLFRSFVIKDFEVVGEIELATDWILISEKDCQNYFKLSDIDNLVITFFGYDSEQYYNSINLSSLIQKQGNKNFVEIHRNGTTYKYEFYLESNRQSKTLLKVANYYSNKLDNFEFIDIRGSKSFKTNKAYSQPTV